MEYRFRTLGDYLVNTKGSTGILEAEFIFDHEGSGVILAAAFVFCGLKQLTEAPTRRTAFLVVRGLGGLYWDAINLSHNLSLSNTLRRNSVSPAPVDGVDSGSIGNRMLNVVPLPSSLCASILPP